MRALRDFALWCVFWAAWTVLVPAVMLSPQGVAVIFAGGGIAAGALILLERSRWWVVLVPLTVAVAVVGYQIGSPPGHILIRTIVDVSAVTLYALVVSRHRRMRSGLGADAGWVVVAAVIAAALRVSVVFLLALLTNSSMEQRLWNATIEIGMSTVVGLVAGSATVIGIAGWRRDMVAAKDRGRAIAIGVGLAVVLLTAYFTGVGSAVPALEFVVFPLLLVSALLLPVPLTALFTGATLIAISIAVGPRPRGIRAGGTGRLVGDPDGADVHADDRRLRLPARRNGRRPAGSSRPRGVGSGADVSELPAVADAGGARVDGGRPARRHQGGEPGLRAAGRIRPRRTRRRAADACDGRGRCRRDPRPRQRRRRARPAGRRLRPVAAAGAVRPPRRR